MGHNRNLADYAHHFDGTHIDLGSGNIETQGVLTYEDVTNVDAIGIVTARAGVKVPDNQKVFLGTGDDLEIYHNGTHSYIHENTGNLRIESDISNNNDIQILNNNTTSIANHSFSYSAKFISGGSVELYEAGSKKLETTTTGATVTGTLVSDSVTSELDLSAISSSISNTATDIFVYDTRKDSDGGAWRKRTQHTSWYNETLNTSTRGSRKEFPAVAVIVVETGQVTIYDGDDPDLPMWMVFNGTGGGASHNLLVNSGTFCLSALNGTVFMGALAIHVNFISEYSRGHRDTGGANYWNGPYNGNIAERNAGKGSTKLSDKLIRGGSTDVAMTVLPNAPIDDATGLPIPTIAIATGGGVSILKDNGTVVDITGTSQGSDAAIDMISFVGNDKIMYSHRYASEINTISSSDVTAAYYNQTSTWVGRISNSISHASTSVVAALSSDNNIESIALTETFAASKSVSGLSLANNYAIQNDPDRASCFVTTDYNTGWMHGDIKGAFLSDTDTTNAVAVYYDDFVNNDNGWGFVNTSISGGNMVITQQGSARSTDGDALSHVSTGVKLVFTGTVSGSGTGTFIIDDDGAGAGQGATTTYGSVSSTGSFNFTATKTGSPRIRIMRTTGSNDYNINFLNISTEYDRSVNNKGLGVYGTVTKSAVATGADLVGYSGNGTSNYLEQPYNSDLDFGANTEFSVMGWMYNTNVGGGQYIFDRSVTYGSSRDWQLWVAADLKYINMYIAGAQAVTSGNNAFPNNAWFQFVVVRTGGFAKIYINGVEKASTASTLSTVPASNVPMKVLFNCNSNTKLSLFRMSSSVPSPEQIKKMYNDEKHLFEENAKATLYGSSDAVTALAYDEDTELLHVGTSSGRSDFQGLRRINNTTTAVTTAISASDELIAEQ